MEGNRSAIFRLVVILGHSWAVLDDLFGITRDAQRDRLFALACLVVTN